MPERPRNVGDGIAKDTRSARQTNAARVGHTGDEASLLMEQVVQRFKTKLRVLLHQGRGRNLGALLRELAPILRGWVAYYRLSEIKVTLESLDQWLRRKLRRILWKQWKTWRTRLRELVRLGLDRKRAAASACNGRVHWWNAGASHMHEAVPNRLLHRWGLVNVLQEHRRLACNL